MKFQYFKENLSKLSRIKTGGIAAQFKLAPEHRKKFSEVQFASKKNKKSAVLVLFYPDKDGETCFLLTLRASYNGTHSSQISFPGGKYEKSDNTLKNTAIREANEEVGIHLNQAAIFKQMTNVYIPPSNFLVTPFLGCIDYTPAIVKNHEVEKIIHVRLSDLLNDDSISSVTVSTSYAKNMLVPCFLLNGYNVWGATAMILSEIRELLKEI